MPRGGPRPGAGAPIANRNALKHGRHSRYARALLFYLLPRSPIALLHLLSPYLTKTRPHPRRRPLTPWQRTLLYIVSLPNLYIVSPSNLALRKKAKIKTIKKGAQPW